MRKPEPDLGSALDRLVAAGLLFQQGIAPQASYVFKHALVQDAAYGTLLREPRRALHARIAETLESQFAEIAEKRLRALGVRREWDAPRRKLGGKGDEAYASSSSAFVEFSTRPPVQAPAPHS